MEEPLAMRMLYSYFFANRDPDKQSISSEENWIRFQEYVSRTKTGVLLITDAISIICHDQRVNYSNKDPWIILVIDEMLLVEHVFGPEYFGALVHRLGELLENRTIPLFFFHFLTQ